MTTRGIAVPFLRPAITCLRRLILQFLVFFFSELNSEAKSVRIHTPWLMHASCFGSIESEDWIQYLHRPGTRIARRVLVFSRYYIAVCFISKKHNFMVMMIPIRNWLQCSFGCALASTLASQNLYLSHVIQNFVVSFEMCERIACNDDPKIHSTNADNIWSITFLPTIPFWATIH